ncbi:TMV resistance protein N-like [Rutidosis leptorrhynchoides]|uniref:TMV resistance protein N-like n=1 Tax=Rutidosis leptorrhynchoides TaxID=125765 RepID=UPI003A9A6142
MASSSTSLVQKCFRYDVFISFRGEDTRKTFVDHLYYAFKDKGILTYKDDKEIRQGRKISDELIISIENSNLYIIVFSKNYASSSWCLDELVKIMECQMAQDQIAYPVFYDVEPTEVRKQIGAVGEAFAKHVNSEAAGKWRGALQEAADLAGWELKTIANGHEAEFIKQIVEKISLELPPIWFSSADENLIGMKSRVDSVVSSLEIGIDDFRVIGIKGMGGGGKTTLARAVFDQISHTFEGQSFVANVREVSKASGLKSVQKQILSDVSKDQGITVNDVYDGKNKMKRMMPGRRVLVVLDDVDHVDQLEGLAIEPKWFKLGSRIIVTTRDEQVLKVRGVKLDILDVNLLSEKEAICLFSRYAFGSENPIQGYEKLSEQVVRYADGLPLTIKVLGSFLCDEDKPEWEDALKRLETIPLKETLEKLEISYIGLEDDYKEIFLDVVCLLKGWRKDDAIKALESQGYNARIGLRVLEQKSLITIDKYNWLNMHDHIEEMGKNIVRRLHPDEPWRHSRLWIEEEIKDILENDQGMEATRGIHLGSMVIEPKILMNGLQNMKKLRFLCRRYDSYYYSDSSKIGKCGPYLPNSLQYLEWYKFPFECLLSKTFTADNLVRLELRRSNIVRLWEDGERKVLNKLRFLNLSGSNLVTFDFEFIPNLESLNLSDCRNIVEFNIPNGFPKLKFLNLTHSTLRILNLGPIPDLETLNVEGCEHLVELHIPFQCPKLKSIILKSEEFTRSKLKILDLGLISYLETLCLAGCDLAELHIPKECPNLKYLYLSLSWLRKLTLGRIPNLESLTLGSCFHLLELHMPHRYPKLSSIILCECSKLNKLDLGPISDLETLSLEGCDLVELHMPDECPNLKYLNLGLSKLRKLSLGLTPDLESLIFDGCCDLVELHMPNTYQKLKSIIITCSKLDLNGCGRFESFLFAKMFQSVEMGSFSGVYLVTESKDICPFHPDNSWCKFRITRIYKEEPVPMYAINFESLALSACHLRYMKKLTLEGNIHEAPKDLDHLQCVEELTFSTKEIKNLPDSLCMLKQLKSLCLKSCWLIEKLPEDLGLLECLEELIVTDCVYLRGIPNSICKMERLKYLHLTHCFLVEKLPEEIGVLESLKELNIQGSGINRLPLSIFRLKGLRIVGTRWRLQSYGFTSIKDTTMLESFCYI